MVQQPSAMPHPLKPHGLNQQYNQSVFHQSAPTRMNDNNQQAMGNTHPAANKMSHHSQEVHGFYNQPNYGGHPPFNNSNGAGSSSMPNNFYMPHYSVSSLRPLNLTNHPQTFLFLNLFFLATSTATATTAAELEPTTAIFQINKFDTTVKCVDKKNNNLVNNTSMTFSVVFTIVVN